MGFTKGNSLANVGYSCLFRELINGYRAIWSATPGTTDPLAPFGAVALPTGGSEGGPNMGAMRLAQTMGHGVLPTPSMPNTWIVQAYDLEDQWDSGNSPCFATPDPYHHQAWACCPPPAKGYNATTCAGREGECAPACQAQAGTTPFMGVRKPLPHPPIVLAHCPPPPLPNARTLFPAPRAPPPFYFALLCAAGHPPTLKKTRGRALGSGCLQHCLRRHGQHHGPYPGQLRRGGGVARSGL